MNRHLKMAQRISPSTSNMEKIFVDGLRFERPREGAPEFVKGRIGINVEKLQTFLLEHGNGQEWLNADLLQSKDGNKLYFQLNTWKPGFKAAETGSPLPTSHYPEYPEGPVGEIPF